MLKDRIQEFMNQGTYFKVTIPGLAALVVFRIARVEDDYFEVAVYEWQNGTGRKEAPNIVPFSAIALISEYSH